ncbi:MAG: hypothetical protein AAGD32_07460 [Planctomycetota bacterium]
MSAIDSPTSTSTHDVLPSKRFTVDDMMEMVRIGLIPEDATHELLDGVIVRKLRNARGEDPMSIGFWHRLLVEFFSDLKPMFAEQGCFLNTQQPLGCLEDHQP